MWSSSTSGLALVLFYGKKNTDLFLVFVAWVFVFSL